MDGNRVEIGVEESVLESDHGHRLHSLLDDNHVIMVVTAVLRNDLAQPMVNGNEEFLASSGRVDKDARLLHHTHLIA